MTTPVSPKYNAAVLATEQPMTKESMERVMFHFEKAGKKRGETLFSNDNPDRPLFWIDGNEDETVEMLADFEGSAGIPHFTIYSIGDGKNEDNVWELNNGKIEYVIY